MKAKLVFKLPKENADFHYATKGIDYATVIDNLFNYLRRKEKDADQNLISHDELRKFLIDEMEERGLTEY